MSLPKEKFVQTVKFKCLGCNWEGPVFVPSHGIDISSCAVCNMPEDGFLWYDPTKMLTPCPGCGVERQRGSNVAAKS